MTDKQLTILEAIRALTVGDCPTRREAVQSDNDLMRIIIADSPKMQELYDVYTKAKDLFEGIKENILQSWLQVGCKSVAK